MGTNWMGTTREYAVNTRQDKRFATKNQEGCSIARHGKFYDVIINGRNLGGTPSQEQSDRYLKALRDGPVTWEGMTNYNQDDEPYRKMVLGCIIEKFRVDEELEYSDMFEDWVMAKRNIEVAIESSYRFVN